MHPLLKAMLKQTIIRQPYLSRDDHDDYTWDTLHTTSFLCRIENKERLIKMRDGKEILSTSTIYCDSDTIIDYRDQLMNPIFRDVILKILKIDFNQDSETGKLDHIIIYTR